MEDNKKEQMQQIADNVQKHKKAILYSFFDVIEELLIDNLEILIDEKERIQALITFEHGKKVFYESGTLLFEQGFQKYLTWLNQNIFREKKMYCKNILIYADCGFVEYVDEQECHQEEQQDYFYRLGALVVVLASLSIDIKDNLKIVKKGEQPVIQDFFGKIPHSLRYGVKEALENITIADVNMFAHGVYNECFQKGYQDTLQFMMLHENEIKQVVKMYFCNLGY